MATMVLLDHKVLQVQEGLQVTLALKVLQALRELMAMMVLLGHKVLLALQVHKVREATLDLRVQQVLQVLQVQ